MVPVAGSNGLIGYHDEPNTLAPVIVIGRKGSHGEVNFSDASVFAIDTTYFVDERHTSADLRWLYFALQCTELTDESLDSAVPGLSREHAYGKCLPVPPVAEQRAVADYLDTETARIDTLISKKRRLIDLLAERWRSEVRYRMHSLSEEHGAIPLKRMILCLDGERVPLSAEERFSRPGPYPYYGASGVIDSVDDYLFDETLVLLGEDGAQLADPDYEVSFVTQGKVWVNNHAHVLRATNADPRFLAMHLSCVDRGPFISGATREKITQADMNEIPVPSVSEPIQREIAMELQTTRARCDRAASALARQTDLLVEQRRALVTSAVTGEIRVRTR